MNRYPRGKLKDDDEGELEIRICHHDSTVVIDFGKPVVWIGIDAALARTIAAALLQHAGEIDGRKLDG